MKTKPKKYTESFVEKEVADLLAELKRKKSIVFKGQLIESKQYSRQRLSEWAKRFSENERISDTIKKIGEICESRLYTKALKGDYNPTLTIFGLKNNHGWKDRHEHDHTSRRAYEHLTDDELDSEIERMERIQAATKQGKDD